MDRVTRTVCAVREVAVQTSEFFSGGQAPKPNKDEAARIAGREDFDPRQTARCDAAAMKRLYDRHGVDVFRFLYRLVQDSALAESLTGEVFLEAWHQSEKKGAGSPDSDRLLALAYKLACAELTAGRSKSGRSLLKDLMPGAPRPTSAADDQIRHTLLKQRAIADLVYYHRKSLSEVAAILAIPREAISLPLTTCWDHP
jgi:RNA polymerase sigma-70 factor, ECF subfamily